MTSNEEIVRAAYRTAEGNVQDLEGWRNAFTEDGVFNNIAAGESYTGERLGDARCPAQQAHRPTGNKPSSLSSLPAGPTARSLPNCTCLREPSRFMSGGY